MTGSPILPYERQQLSGVSDEDNERLGERSGERLGEIEDSTATSRLSRAMAARASIDENLVKFEASTAKHRLPFATSDLDNDRHDEDEASVVDQELSYIVNELTYKISLSLESRGLTWDDETVENASSVLSSSLNIFADKLDKSGSRLGFTFIQKHQL